MGIENLIIEVIKIIKWNWHHFAKKFNKNDLAYMELILKIHSFFQDPLMDFDSKFYNVNRRITFTIK